MLLASASSIRIDDVARNEGLLSELIIPASTAASIPTNSQTIFAVLIDVQPGAADLIGQQAASQLRPDQPDRLKTLVPQDPRALRESIESDVTSLLFGLARLALLVGMIGIANATLVAVLERRGEIGVRRALGARRWHIGAQFLTESAVLGFAGGVIGTSPGIIAVAAVRSPGMDYPTLNRRYQIETLDGPGGRWLNRSQLIVATC